MSDTEWDIIPTSGLVGPQTSPTGTVYVAADGNDRLYGHDPKTAVKTIGRALELAAARNGAVTLIDLLGTNTVIGQGHYDVPDNTIVRSVHRAWSFQPAAGYEERNVFRLGSGCFLEGPLFEGWRLNSLTDPTEGFAVSFRPGAVIRRVPYAHKIAVRSMPTWGLVAPPLDRANGNPEVPRGGGVVLADGLVCSPYSVFPNIMTWGATPVTPNGIGYCAKNGALINAVNAVSIWAHVHFQALSGGQVILSACSTQFGDYSMQASGYRWIILPTEVDIALTQQSLAESSILAAQSALIDAMWLSLVQNGYTVGWSAKLEALTRADAATLLQCLRWTLKTANEQPMLDFAKGLFDTAGEPVFASDKLSAFLHAFEFLRDGVKALAGVGAEADAIVDALIDALVSTVTSPVRRKDPSRITAIGHTWTAAMAGVALTKIPPAENQASIQDSILEEDEGVVIASGQDDQGNALFVGGLQINADTGELGGPPFEQAVRRVAIRAAISRSF